MTLRITEAADEAQRQRRKQYAPDPADSPTDTWVSKCEVEYLVHLLTGLPGVGVELAGRIVDKFSGVPVQWTVTKGQLLEVEGLGKKKVDAMTRVVPAKTTREQTPNEGDN